MSLTFRLLIIAVALAPARQVEAQPVSTAGLAVEVVTRDRWIHGRERALFTPPVTQTSWISIDLLRADPALGELVVRGRWGGTNATNMFSISATTDGRIRSIDAPLAPLAALSALAQFLPSTTPRTAVSRMVETGRRLTLPAVRAWDLVPAFHPPRLEAGATWIDTLDLQTTVDEHTQSVRGVRVSRIVRDTTVDGRRLWIVADSAAVTYHEAFLEWQRSLGANARFEKTASGFIRGRLLYDPELRVHRARRDTTALSGTAVLIFPDARRFTTPVTLERTRTWKLYEPAQYLRRQEEIRLEAQATRSFNFSGSPVTPLQERLYAGDTGARDSVFARWRVTTDADERAALFTMLEGNAYRFPGFAPVLENARVASGDTAFLFQRLSRSVYPSGPIDEADVRALLPFLEDPGLILSFNLSHDVGYENLVYRVQHYGPITEPATSARHSTAAALNLMAAQWRRNVEPRLRHVGLYVTAMIDPKFADTLVREFRSGNAPLLASAIPIIEGIGNSAPAAVHLPLPEAGAAWTVWRDWLGATNPAYPAPASPIQRNPLWMGRAGNSGAIRYREKATARDITGELRRNFATATSDTARIVFTQILNGLGASPWSVEELARVVRDGPQLLRAAALNVVGSLYAPVAGVVPVPADSALADSIIDRLIANGFSRRDPWRTLEEKRTGISPPIAPASPAGLVPRYLASDSLNTRLREKWRGIFAPLSRAEWDRMPVRQGGTFTRIAVVQRVGPFLRVGFVDTSRGTVAANVAPTSWASSTTWILMEMDGEWVVVAKMQAAT